MLNYLYDPPHLAGIYEQFATHNKVAASGNVRNLATEAKKHIQV